MNTERFLDENVKPATGCTEPVAIGYAVSLAYNSIFGNLPDRSTGEVPRTGPDPLKAIKLRIGKGVYKNAFSIPVPGTDGEKGVDISAAMGVYLDPENELDLFKDVNDELLKDARKIKESNKISVVEVKDKSEFDIEVELEYEEEDEINKSNVRLKKFHDHIYSIEVNGKILYKDDSMERDEDGVKVPETIEEMVEVAKNIDEKVEKRVYEGIEMNTRLADIGLQEKYGIEVGKKIKQMMDSGELSDDLINKVKMKTAAAADARMGGIDESVMSTSGSGNQGITVLVPIGVVGKEKGYSKRRMAEAAMLAHQVTKFSTERSSYLSALCGCSVKAGMGTAAGITYLMGGKAEEIKDSINILAGNVTGMICDGAKEGCALKISTAAGEAVESSLMALKGLKVPYDNGIIGKTAEETLENIGKISDEMAFIDMKVIEILEKKD